jgi:hypothetical protein
MHRRLPGCAPRQRSPGPRHADCEDAEMPMPRCRGGGGSQNLQPVALCRRAHLQETCHCCCWNALIPASRRSLSASSRRLRRSQGSTPSAAARAAPAAPAAAAAAAARAAAAGRPAAARPRRRLAGWLPALAALRCWLVATPPGIPWRSAAVPNHDSAAAHSAPPAARAQRRRRHAGSPVLPPPARTLPL